MLTLRIWYRIDSVFNDLTEALTIHFNWIKDWQKDKLTFLLGYFIAGDTENTLYVRLVVEFEIRFH